MHHRLVRHKEIQVEQVVAQVVEPEVELVEQVEMDLDQLEDREEQEFQTLLQIVVFNMHLEVLVVEIQVALKQQHQVVVEMVEQVLLPEEMVLQTLVVVEVELETKLEALLVVMVDLESL